jgi:hypothetical protein
VAEYEVHYLPDTEIRAGEYVRPRLEARREGSKIKLTWTEPAEGFVLERRRAAGGGAWEPVPGVTGTGAVLEASDAPWLFRMRRP